MKSRIYKGFLCSFIATLTIYAILKSDILEKFHFSEFLSLRLLAAEATDESINKMCSKSSLNLVEFYKTTPPDYDYNVPTGSKTLNKIAEGFLKGSASFEPSIIKDYFFENGVTIFVLVLFIFLIIFWIPFCACICCKGCLCVPQILLKYIKFIFIGCLVICLVICIVCIIGFAQNSSILSGIYGFGCTFLKLTRHLIYGDEYTLKKPYWSGLTPILDKFEQTQENISDLFNKTVNLKNDLVEINALFDNLEQNLEIEFSIRNETLLENPEPEKEQFFPIKYIDEYGPPNNVSTTLGLIYDNLTIFEPYTLGRLGGVLEIVSLDNETTHTIVNSIGNFMDIVDENINEIDRKIANVLGDVDEAIDDINSFSRKAMNTMFGINLGLIILIIVSLVLIYFYKFGHCILCCSWTFLYIFMLLSIIIGALFLVLGLFLQNLSYGLSNIIKDIRKIDKDSKVFEAIDVCFNGDGLLYKTFASEDLNISLIDKIYNIENSISKDINEINKYEFIAIKKAEEKYDDFKNYPKKYIDELVFSLDNVKKYIDGSWNETYVSEDSEFYDEWELNKEDCNEEYEYLSPSSNMRRLITTNKLCLVITEWDESEIQERYSTIKSKDDSDIFIEIMKYYNSIMKFDESKELLIDSIKKENQKFNESLNSIKEKAISMLTTIINIVQPLRKSFADIVGEGSIFEILNCSFLRRDFNKLMQVLYEEFGKTFRKTSDLFFTICVFQIVMTLLILIIIAHIKLKKEEEESSTKNGDYIGLKDVGKLNEDNN